MRTRAVEAYQTPHRPNRYYGKRILTYGIYNDYPQVVRDLLGNSGVATSVTKKYAAHIRGNGFVDDALNYQIINRKGQTVSQLLRLITKAFSIYNGFALHFNYNGLMQICEIQVIRFEHCRFGHPDFTGHIPKIAVWNNWDALDYSLERVKTVEYIDTFNPDPEVVSAQVERAGGINNYKGQILYYTGDSLEYPYCTFHPRMKDVESDAQAQTFRNRNLKTGFMASGFVRTERMSDKDEEALQKELEKFQGADRSHKLMHIQTAKENFDYTPTELPNVDAKFEYSEKSIKENLTQLFGQTPALYGLKTAGQLGSASEIDEAFQLYNQHTRDERNIFQELFKKVSNYTPRPLGTNFEIEPLRFEVDRPEQVQTQTEIIE